MTAGSPRTVLQARSVFRLSIVAVPPGLQKTTLSDSDGRIYERKKVLGGKISYSIGMETIVSKGQKTQLG
jgi:hypothetical protein